jgi:hypothetical protein
MSRRLIENRRKVEQNYHDTDYAVVENKRQHHIATFEISTAAKSKEN